MTTNRVLLNVDPECLVLQMEAVETLRRAEGELVLDFSAVVRIDSRAVLAMERLADLASQTSRKIELRAVNTTIYRTLKLLKVAPRFTVLS
jgi:anti-anti-sigma regulatory factor